MDAELRQTLIALASSRAVAEVERGLPLEEVAFAVICENEQWQGMLERYLRTALQRSDSVRGRNTVQLLAERVNFELQRRGEKRLKL